MACEYFDGDCNDCNRCCVCGRICITGDDHAMACINDGMITIREMGDNYE